MSREKFCPSCGKQTEKFYDNLCRECFLKSIETVQLPDRIVVKHCRICGKFYGNERGQTNLEAAVNDNLAHAFDRQKIQSASYRIGGNKVHSEATIEEGGLRKAVELDFDLTQKQTICKFCSQKLSGYFNAILQVRGSSKPEKIFEEIQMQLKKINEKDSLAFVSKVEHTRNGVDVYVGSKSAAYKVSKFLKSRYRAKVKISRKQYGFQQGKKVYRDTILILLSD